MLRIMRKGSRWVMWLVIIGVGAVFVLYLGLGGGYSGGGGPQILVDVDGRQFDARDVQRARARLEDQYRMSLGDGFDADAAQQFLDESAASTLMQRALLAREAERMGLSVSDAEVRGYLRQIPGTVNEEGRIDQDSVTYFAEREYGTLRRFQEVLRDDLLATKAQRLLYHSVDVSNAEALESLRYKQASVRIAAVKFAAGEDADEIEITDEEIAGLIESDPDRVRDSYTQRESEFDSPEQVRARHILIRAEGTDESETTADARRRIEAVQQRLAAGESFEELAREESEDPGSKERGGDLGLFPRGRMVKEFEEVAFTQEPGVVSDVVRSSFGFHLILVEEKQAPIVVPYEEAQLQVARDLLLQEKAAEGLRARAEELAEAVRQGQSLVDVARERSLAIERPDPLVRRPDGFISGIGASTELMTAAFALTEETPSDGKVHELRNGSFVLIELLGRDVPDDAELQAQVESERMQLLTDRRQQNTALWLMNARTELAENGKLVYDLSGLR